MNPVTTQFRPSDTAPAPIQLSDAGPPLRPRTSRLRDVWRGPSGDPSWARPALFALLVVTAAAYFYNLTASGWANSFYSAAVQAGSDNWEAFLFGSSDAANSITVDKPPAALWVMALSVRAFGLSSFAILMPQVLMGVGAVAVVYATVKRYFSPAAGLIAGVVLALTPVAVLMFRFNNPDALLTLLMALGGWATMRAIERGSIKWMMIVGAFIGFGFLTKTFQVFLVVPFFGIAYLVAANTTLRRRILGSLAGLGAMVFSAGWWVAIVSLTPASLRPYVGGSQDNSFWSLTFGYNGFGRLTGDETGSVGGTGGTGSQWGSTGITRMLGNEVGAQISWLIPTALILLGAALVVRGRRPRTDLRRAFYLVWGGWLIVTALTFSFMAGIFHQYYTVALAPAVATIVGAGAWEMWQRRGTALGRYTLAAATGTAAIWAFVLLGRTTAYGEWLRVSVLAFGVAAALLLLVVGRVHARLVPLVIAAALMTGLAGPAAYSFSTLQQAHTGSIVLAGPTSSGADGIGGPGGGGAPGQAPGGAPGQTPGGAPGQTPGGTTGGGAGGLLDASTPSVQVVAALQGDSSSFTWAAAAIGSQSAAGLQLGSGEPVMAIGGFNGSDPSPTLAQFQAYAEAGQIHYFLASSGGGPGGSSESASAITTWVTANYTQVTIGSTTFYDLTQPTTSS